MKKKTGEGKGQISTEDLFKLADKYSKSDDVHGLLKDLIDNHGFIAPKPANILQRLSPYLVKTGKSLYFPSLASAGERKIHWSSKGLTISSKAVDEKLYKEALEKKINYSVEMHPDLSVTLKPKKE